MEQSPVTSKMRRLTLFIYSAVVMLVGGLLGVTPSAAQIAVLVLAIVVWLGVSLLLQALVSRWRRSR